MKFALTQMDIQWENPDANRHICRQFATEAAAAGCDWIIFPEMTLTGFTMRPELFAEAPKQASADFFCRLSQTLHINIIYGYIADIQGCFHNHLVYVQNGSIIGEYAKLHPFSFSGETLHYHRGTSLLVCPTDTGVCMSGFICYDLRFPEIFQAVSRQAPIIVVIANWPAERIQHWYTLLQARAIENQSFLLGVNRIGTAENSHYPASSVAYSPDGERLTPAASDSLLYLDLNPDTALQCRRDFPLKADRREEFYSRFYF